MGPDSVPVRMRGTCIDITESVLADEEKAQIAARFQSLVESAPDAILVLDKEQRILGCNAMAREILGGDPMEHDIAEILPAWPATEALGAHALSLDGRSLVLDVTRATVNQDEESGASFVALYLRDANRG